MTAKRSATLLMVGNHLSAAGYAKSTCETLASRLAESGLDVLITSSKPGRLARLLDMLWSVFRWRHHYDLAYVEVYSGLAFFWAEAVCRVLRWLKKPIVLSLHGGNLPDFSDRHPVRVRKLLAMANDVVAPSRYLADSLKTFRADIRLIPNGIDLAPYLFHLRETPAPKLIWLRAFHEIYNPRMAIEVIQHLADDFPDVQLLMIGPDKDGSLEAMKAYASRCGVPDKIVFTGRIAKEEVPEYLNKGDIFINTTNIDNMPVSVVEAMACGLCSVSTNVGGIPFLLAHEVDALLVPSGDVEAMAAAVRRFLTDSQLASRLSRNARNKAELFDWSKILPQWEDLFITIAKQKRAN